MLKQTRQTRVSKSRARLGDWPNGEGVDESVSESEKVGRGRRQDSSSIMRRGGEVCLSLVALNERSIEEGQIDEMCKEARRTPTCCGDRREASRGCWSSRTPKAVAPESRFGRHSCTVEKVNAAVTMLASRFAHNAYLQLPE